jgi:hypothetical protein
MNVSTQSVRIKYSIKKGFRNMDQTIYEDDRILPLIDDKRKIKCLVFEDETEIKAGGLICDEIIPYQENGEMAPITWFACYRDSILIQRVNSKYIALVTYYLDENS